MQESCHDQIKHSVFSMVRIKSSDAALPNRISLSCVHMKPTGTSKNVSKVVGAANVVSCFGRAARVAELLWHCLS